MKYGNSPRHVADYFLYLSNRDRKPLTPMQLHKLVYIAHGWQLGLYGRPLVNESIEAWKYGPVISSLYQQYKRYGSQVIEDGPTEKPTGFDADEESTIEQVWDGYGARTGVSLSSLTHEPGTPWSTTIVQSGPGSIISNDLIEDYYHRRSLRRQ